MARGEWQRVKVANERPRQIVVHTLGIAPRQSSHSIDRCSRRQISDKLGHGFLRLAANHIHVAVRQAAFHKMRRPGTHQYHLDGTSAFSYNLYCLQISFYRQIDSPHQVYVRVIVPDKIFKSLAILAGVHKIAVFYLVFICLLQYGCNCKLINIGGKIYHTRTAGCSLSRLLVVETRRYYKREFHL